MLMVLLVLFEIPVLLILIVITNIRADSKRQKSVESFGGKPAEYYNTAVRMASMGENKYALASLRDVLEALTKIIGRKYGYSFSGPDYGLLQQIDTLYDIGAINSYQCSQMHNLRKATNKGHHVNINELEITSVEVNSALKLTGDLLSSLKNTHPDLFEQKEQKSNVLLWIGIAISVLVLVILIVSYNSGKNSLSVLSPETYMDHLAEISEQAESLVSSEMQEILDTNTAGEWNITNISLESAYYVTETDYPSKDNTRIILFYTVETADKYSSSQNIYRVDVTEVEGGELKYNTIDCYGDYEGSIDDMQRWATSRKYTLYEIDI